MAERPGIMLYFDMAEPLKGLGYEEKGRLLEAILDYGQFGVDPKFDGFLTIAWGFIRPKLDADAMRYRKTVVQKTHASYCAKEKKAGRTPLDFEEWCVKERIDTEWNHVVSCDTERHPTTTTTATTASKATTTTTATTETSSTADADGEVKGEEEKDFEALRREKLAMLGKSSYGR